MANTKCKSCGAEVFWIKTEAGKQHPVDAKYEMRWTKFLDDDGKIFWGLVKTFKSHFATCPQAKTWSNKGKS